MQRILLPTYIMYIAASAIMLFALEGCAEPAAVSDLLLAADASLQAVADANAEIERAATGHLEQEVASLDSAFMSDLEQIGLREQSLDVATVRDAKEFYDARRAGLDASREQLQEAFDRRRRSLEAARMLIAYARQLAAANRTTWQDVQNYIEYVTAASKPSQSPSQ